MNLFVYRAGIRTAVHALVRLCRKSIQECPTCRAPVVVATSMALLLWPYRELENHFPAELMQRKSEEQEEALEKERIRSTLSIFLPGMVAMPNQNSFTRFRAKISTTMRESYARE